MPRKPAPGGRKYEEKKAALVFTAAQTRYRKGNKVTAAQRSNKAYNSPSIIRWVAGFATAIPSMLPTQPSLDDGESHEDKRQGPADGTGIAQITDLKPILIEIHHHCEPTVFRTGTIQEDKRQLEQLKTADQRQENDKACHRCNRGQDHIAKFLPAI